jgi:hypothetical protein
MGLWYVYVGLVYRDGHAAYCIIHGLLVMAVHYIFYVSWFGMLVYFSTFAS